MASTTRIHLRKSMFAEKERDLVTAGDLVASTFRYCSGVEALRVTSNVRSAVFLPFQGQQMLGRTLTMKSMFEEPAATTDYLRTYGAFLIHCGFTSMGVPAEGDDHPLHGELPNAPYGRAYLLDSPRSVRIPAIPRPPLCCSTAPRHPPALRNVLAESGSSPLLAHGMHTSPAGIHGFPSAPSVVQRRRALRGIPAIRPQSTKKRPLRKSARLVEMP